MSAAEDWASPGWYERGGRFSAAMQEVAEELVYGCSLAGLSPLEVLTINLGAARQRLAQVEQQLRLLGVDPEDLPH